MENGLTHFDQQGNAVMVDVSEKAVTHRIAVASGKIFVNQAVYDAIVQGTVKKGDVLGVARVAGIMAAKNPRIDSHVSSVAADQMHGRLCVVAGTTGCAGGCHREGERTDRRGDGSTDRCECGVADHL